MEKYLDSTLPASERARDLLSKMSLEEKMAQTVSIFPMYSMMGKDSVELSRESCRFGIGSVSTLEVKTIPTLEGVQNYQKRMQTMIMEQSPHHIPAMFHMEGLCGAFIQDALSIPSGVSRGASFDPGLEEKLAQAVARQERAAGITQILAPVLDVARDARMGRVGESYGEDPTLAAAMGVAFTRGVQDTARRDGLKAESVAKHFLGFHNSLGGIHGAEGLSGPRQLEEIFGRSFQAAVAEANLRGIMPCYCTLDGEATHTSKRLLTTLLREEMGFQGIVCSDYSGVSNAYVFDGLFDSPQEAGLAAMEAGLDMEWPSAFGYNDKLREMFAEGSADMSVLDWAVCRILEAKFRMGLFEHPFALEGEELKSEFYQESDYALSLQSARESLVLLKNDGVLPLSNKVKKIAVIGGKADNARILFGGYTNIAMTEATVAQRNSIAGIGNTGQLLYREDYPKYPGTQVQSDETPDFDAVQARQKPGCPSILGELKKRLPQAEITWAYGYPVAGDDTSHYEEALEAIRNADAGILVLGGKWSSGSIATTGEGVDTTDINLPRCQELFLREAARLGKPLAGVHLDGRAISSDAADQCLNAILEAWAPSEAGAEAIMDVLTGKVAPSGKLPVSVAFNAGQIPVHYNHPNGSSTHQATSIGFTDYLQTPHKARYGFGYGLSYTTFAYGNLSVDRETVEPEGEVRISFDVTNTGAAAGTEIVQIYLQDVRARMVRPCMELAGFGRVELEPGQTKRVTAIVSPSQTAYLSLDMRWTIEKGRIHVMVGAASDDIRLESDFDISRTIETRGRERRFYARIEIGE